MITADAYGGLRGGGPYDRKSLKACVSHLFSRESIDPAEGYPHLTVAAIEDRAFEEECSWIQWQVQTLGHWTLTSDICIATRTTKRHEAPINTTVSTVVVIVSRYFVDSLSYVFLKSITS